MSAELTPNRRLLIITMACMADSDDLTEVRAPLVLISPCFCGMTIVTVVVQ